MHRSKTHQSASEITILGSFLRETLTKSVRFVFIDPSTKRPLSDRHIQVTFIPCRLERDARTHLLISLSLNKATCNEL